MKSVVLCGLMLAAFSPKISNAEVLMNLNEAFKNRAISIKVVGHEAAYQQANLQIRNTLPFTIAIKVEAGRRFIAYESSTRDVLVTKTEYVRVPPFATVIKDIFSLGCEKFDAKPKAGDQFSIGKMADKDLQKLAMEIETNGLWDREGVQEAIYVVSDHESIDNMGVKDWNRNEQWKGVFTKIGVSESSDETKTIRGLENKKVKPNFPKQKEPSVINEMPEFPSENKVKPEVAAVNEPEAIASAPDKKVVYQVKHNHQFDLPQSGKVSLILYDPENNKASDLIKNKIMTKGKHQQKIDFKTDEFKQGSYALRLFLNGEMISEKKFHLASKN